LAKNLECLTSLLLYYCEQGAARRIINSLKSVVTNKSFINTAPNYKLRRMVSKKSVEDGKIYAFLGVFLTVIGFLIVLLTKKDNKYAMFYAKQGLILFIVYVVIAISVAILTIVPFIGGVVSMILWIVFVILWLIGLIYALSGEMKDIPFVGEYARKLNL
jgi:uncharacterized membrane protein